MANDRNDYGALVPAVDRAAQILKTLASSDSALGISELSRQLRLNKSTVHDIVATLYRHNLLERDDATKTYRLGHGLAELGYRVGERSELRVTAQARLLALANAVDETAFLGTFHDGHVTIVDKVEAAHDVKITSPLGRRLYYSAGAFGKIFLAGMSEAEAKKLMHDRPLRAYTRKSITKTAAYRVVLRRVRAQGYALDDEEYLEGVRAAAAAVVDARGSVVAALCVVGFSTRLSLDKLARVAKQTRDAAEQISRQLGAAEYPAWNGVE